MKATRAAIKTAKNIEELAVEMAEMRGQLNRIEDMLPNIITEQMTRLLDAMDEQVRQSVNEKLSPSAEAKPVAKPKGK